MRCSVRIADDMAVLKRDKDAEELTRERFLKYFPGLKEDLDGGYISLNMEPLKCIKCDSVDFKDITTDFWEGHICEYKRVCKCGHQMGNWAYGNWMI